LVGVYVTYSDIMNSTLGRNNSIKILVFISIITFAIRNAGVGTP